MNDLNERLEGIIEKIDDEQIKDVNNILESHAIKMRNTMLMLKLNLRLWTILLMMPTIMWEKNVPIVNLLKQQINVTSA